MGRQLQTQARGEEYKRTRLRLGGGGKYTPNRMAAGKYKRRGLGEGGGRGVRLILFGGEGKYKPNKLGLEMRIPSVELKNINTMCLRYRLHIRDFQELMRPNSIVFWRPPEL